MKNSISPHFIFQTILIAVTYVILGEIGQSLAIEPGNVTPIWPPSGLAFALVLLMGNRALYGIFLGAFLINTFGFSEKITDDNLIQIIISGLFIGIGSSLQPFLGAMLLKHFFHYKELTAKVKNYLIFIVIVPIITVTSSAIGTIAMYFTGIISSDLVQEVWITWWLGDGAGIILFAPFLLVWRELPKIRFSVNTLKTLFVISLLILLTLISFSNLFMPTDINHNVHFITLTCLIWIGLMYSSHTVTLSILIHSMISIWYTKQGIGPFHFDDINSSILVLELFLLVTSSTAMIVLVLVNERKKVLQTLEQNNKNLELTVQERTHDLRLMIKELNHRVKNNFQVILTFLWAQKKSIKDEPSLRALEQTKQRIYAISSLHELLNISDTVSININRYVEGIINSFLIENSAIKYNTNIENIVLDYDEAVTVGLILNELITNSHKYAFEFTQSPNINVQFYEKEGMHLFKYSDNGVGFDADKLANISGLGYDLIYGFAQKTDAKLSISSNEGMEITITFDKKRI